MAAAAATTLPQIREGGYSGPRGMKTAVFLWLHLLNLVHPGSCDAMAFQNVVNQKASWFLVPVTSSTTTPRCQHVCNTCYYRDKSQSERCCGAPILALVQSTELSNVHNSFLMSPSYPNRCLPRACAYTCACTHAEMHVCMHMLRARTYTHTGTENAVDFHLHRAKLGRAMVHTHVCAHPNPLQPSTPPLAHARTHAQHSECTAHPARPACLAFPARLAFSARVAC